MKFEVLRSSNNNSQFSQDDIASFLEHHLEQYGDKKADIMKCIDYAWKVDGGRGGFVLVGSEDNVIIGAVIINETGMDGYIPENILVYIAVHGNQRGKGMGRKLMEEAIGNCRGSVALHVEPDNPAKKLYERLGFTNKYLEMRLTR